MTTTIWTQLLSLKITEIMRFTAEARDCGYSLLPAAKFYCYVMGVRSRATAAKNNPETANEKMIREMQLFYFDCLIKVL